MNCKDINLLCPNECSEACAHESHLNVVCYIISMQCIFDESDKTHSANIVVMDAQLLVLHVELLHFKVCKFSFSFCTEVNGTEVDITFVIT